VLIGLRAHLTATTVIFILCNGSRRVGTPAVRKTLTVVKAATAKHQLILLYHCRSHPLPNSTGLYQAYSGNRPSCSTNPRGPSAIFYLSSRRQPTSAPSRFSFSNTSRLPQAIPLTQFTYEYCHHLTCGVRGPSGPPSTFIILQPLPLLEFQQRPTHPYHFNKLPDPHTA